jgi:purine-binding chemotaxis protein CheW
MTMAARDADAVDSPVTTYVLLGVGDTRFCVDVRRVNGVIQTSGVTRVPGAPGQILGVINVRGRVLPLGDLAIVLGDPPSPDGPGATAVLLATDGGESPTFALLGDVLDVVELERDRLEPPPRFGLGNAARLVTAVAHLGPDGLALVLDPECLMRSMGVKEAAE